MNWPWNKKNAEVEKSEVQIAIETEKMELRAQVEKLKKHETELERKVETLAENRRTLKEQVEDLKLEAKTSEEDIRHMMKKKEELLKIKAREETMTIKEDCAEKIAAAKVEYQDKVIELIGKQKDEFREMYKEILDRLPNVNAMLLGKLGDKD